jgi:hypothetical protein
MLLSSPLSYLLSSLPSYPPVAGGGEGIAPKPRPPPFGARTLLKSGLELSGFLQQLPPGATTVERGAVGPVGADNVRDCLVYLRPTVHVTCDLSAAEPLEYRRTL